MAEPKSDLLTLTPDAIISLYVLDLNPFINDKQYFCNWKDTNGENIFFQGFEYTPIPIETEGFELNSRGNSSRPTIKFGNVYALLTALTIFYSGIEIEDLMGAKLIRRRTLSKYLDGKPTSSPSSFFQEEHYLIARKPVENEFEISFELIRAIDQGFKSQIPGRYLFKNTCPWTYRSAECSYTGSASFDINDAPVFDVNSDICGKRVSSCKLRFGQYAELPFGGYPGLDDF